MSPFYPISFRSTPRTFSHIPPFSSQAPFIHAFIQLFSQPASHLFIHSCPFIPAFIQPFPYSFIDNWGRTLQVLWPGFYLKAQMDCTAQNGGVKYKYNRGLLIILKIFIQWFHLINDYMIFIIDSSMIFV